MRQVTGQARLLRALSTDVLASLRRVHVGRNAQLTEQLRAILSRTIVQVCNWVAQDG